MLSFKSLIVVPGLVLPLFVGCSSSPSGTNSDVGSLKVPISTQAPSGRAFVLCEGEVAIEGEQGLGVGFTVEGHLEEPVVTVELPSDSYWIELSDWTLCEVDQNGLEPVEAELLGSELQFFDIAPAEPTFVYYQFRVDGEVVAFNGQLVLGIQVTEGGGSGQACESPIELEPGEGVVSGSTIGAGSSASGTCGGGGAPDEVYSITVEVETRMEVLMTGYDTLLHLRSECDDPDSEILCNDDTQGLYAQLVSVLEPGTYFLWADSYDMGGDYELHYSFRENPCAEDVCPGTPECLPDPDWQGYTCVCPLGTVAWEGECIDDPCYPDPCGAPHTQCIPDLPTSYSCECDIGYIDDGQGNCVPDPNANKWAFLVYLNADSNLSEAGLDDLQEMSQAGSTADVHIIALADTYDGPANLLRIGQGTVEVLEEWGEIDMGDPQTLADFGVWGVENIPAQRFALVMWNHGDGWRARTTENPVIRGFSVDEHPWGEYIGVADGEYASAMQQIADRLGRKIDLIGFDACLMGMWEVAEASAPFADYMVASSEVEPLDGWAYDTALSALIQDPDLTPPELGTILVDTYHSASPENGTLSVTNLGTLDDVALALSDFSNALLQHPEEYDEVREAQFQSQSFYDWDNRDLIDFAIRVAEQPGVSNDTVVAAEALIEQLSTTIVYNQAQAEYPGAHGLAIYLPDGYLDPSYVQAPWSTRTTWDEFLTSFVD